MSIGSFAVAEYLRPNTKSIVNAGTIMRMNNKFFSTYGSTFGKRARLLRQERGWTQIQMSEEFEKIGASAKSAWISELENSDENKFPSIDLVIAYAKVFGTTTDFFLLQTDDPEKVANHRELHWSEEADAAGKLIDSLPAEWRTMALDAVQRVGDEWEEIKKQDNELAELLKRVEKSSNAVTRAIVEDYIRSRLKLLGARRRGDGTGDDTGSKGPNVGNEGNAVNGG